jgi:hypothetical protein
MGEWMAAGACYQFSRSHDAVTSVFGEAGKRDRNARARTGFQKSGEFALIGGEYLLRKLNLEGERQWEYREAQPGISETAPIFPSNDRASR